MRYQTFTAFLEEIGRPLTPLDRAQTFCALARSYLREGSSERALGCLRELEAQLDAMCDSDAADAAESE